MGLALVLAYIVLNLLSPAEMFPALAPYRVNLVLALVSVPPAVITRLMAPEIGKLRTQFILVVLFCGFVSGSWFPHGGLRANLNAFLDLMPNVIVYFVGVVQFRSSSRLKYLRAALVLVAIFVMAKAFVQVPYVRATGVTTPYVLAGGMGDSIGVRIRGLGMLNDPNIFAQFLLLLLPLLFVSTRETGPGPAYFFVIPLAMLLVVGVYFTGSRGAELGLVVIVGLAFITRFKRTGKAIAAVFVPLLLVAIKATSTRTVSMAGGMDRLAIWSDGMSYFKGSPLWGIGFGGFLERNRFTAHNSYLLCAAELGTLGFFLWMSVIVVTLIQLHRVPQVVAKSNPILARWAVAVKIALGGYLFTSYFLSCTYSLPLFLLLGMAGAIIVAAGGDQAVPLQGTNWPVRSLGFCGGLIVLIYVMLRLRAV